MSVSIRQDSFILRAAHNVKDLITNLFLIAARL